MIDFSAVCGRFCTILYSLLSLISYLTETFYIDDCLELKRILIATLKTAKEMK